MLGSLHIFCLYVYCLYLIFPSNEMYKSAPLCRQQNDIQTCNFLWLYQGEISQLRKQSVSFVSHGLGFDPWWSGSLRLGGEQQLMFSLAASHGQEQPPDRGLKDIAANLNVSAISRATRQMWPPFSLRELYLIVNYFIFPWIFPC